MNPLGLPRSPLAHAQRLGFTNEQAFAAVFAVARHLQAGKQIGAAELQALQQTYPAIPAEYLAARAQAINTMPARERVAAFAREVGGEQAVSVTQSLLADYGQALAQERAVEDLSGRLERAADARVEGRQLAQRQDDPLSIRNLLEAQTAPKLPSTFQGARHKIADRLDHVYGTLANPDRYSLRDTIAAAAEKPDAEQAAAALMDEGDHQALEAEALARGDA